MAQIQRGETFVDGQIVNAARLNNLVDLATALKGLVLDQTPLADPISSDDQMVLWDGLTNSLRRATVATFLADAVGVTSVGLTMPSTTFNVLGTNPITSTGNFGVSWKQKNANQVFAGPASGGLGTPDFRALNVADITPATVPIAASNIDWSLGNVFTKSLAANATFTFSNASPGQVITVFLTNTASFTVNWGPSAIRWPGGTAHTMTPLNGHSDMCIFRYINGNYWGTFDKDFKV